MTTSRILDSRSFGDAALEAEFGDRRKHGRRHHGDTAVAFGNATKRKLKRPYKRTVVRKGRKLVGKHKIGQVSARKDEFKWVTRRGGVYAGKVSSKGGRKPARKAARKGRKK